MGGGRLEVVDSRLEVGKWEGGKVGDLRAEVGDLRAEVGGLRAEGTRLPMPSRLAVS